MVVDQQGYRLNIGIIIANASGHLFWGRRIGQDAWQFPQGGLLPEEPLEDALYRELYEEVGLQAEDVEIVAQTKQWLHYNLPDQFIRRHSKPVVIGQKQKWFLLKLKVSEQKIRLNMSASPEFDSWRWVDCDTPPKHVIYFKRHIYRDVLKEFKPYLTDESSAC